MKDSRFEGRIAIILRKLTFTLAIIGLITLLSGGDLYAQEQTPPSDSLVSITLTDGSILRGVITEQDETSLNIKTFSGVEVTIPRSSIVSVDRTKGRLVEGRFYRFDPNYSRLIFSPTGRPLRAGEGYFSDYWVFFPGIAYGFSDQVSIFAGMSVFPGAGLDEQIIFIAPRIGYWGDKYSISGGFLYLSAFGEFGAGLIFAVASTGEQDQSFTAGTALGFSREQNLGFEFAKHPIIMLGGNIRTSNSIAIVSENWLILGEDFNLGQQPLGLAIRFFGDRIAVDAGLIFLLEALGEGFPGFPWLSFVYNFAK